MRKLVRALLTTLSAPVAWLPTTLVERGLLLFVARHASGLAAADALRFLFRIDSALYAMEGEAAIAYGGGVHTKHRHMGYHDFFVLRIQEGERVLDVGCGNGALARDIAERSGARVVGIDSVSSKIQEARVRHAHARVEYLVRDVRDGLPRDPFDVVVLSNVLEHLPDRVDFLRHLQSATCPGRYLIRVPLADREWRVPLKRELGVEWRLDPTHETEYTLESFRDEMEKAGLGVRYHEVRWGEIWAEATAPRGAAE